MEQEYYFNKRKINLCIRQHNCTLEKKVKKKWRKVKTLKNCWTYKSDQEPTALKALLIMRALLV